MKGNTAASVRAVGLSALQRPLLLGRQTGSSVSALLPGSVVHDHNRRSFFSQHKRWQTRMEADTFFKKEYTCDFSTGGGPSSATTSPQFDGLVVGVYSNGKLTPTAKQLDEQSGGEISRRLKLSKAMKGEVGNSLLLLNVAPEVPRVVLVGLGKDPEQKGQQPAPANDNETEKTYLDEDHADAKEDPVDAVRQAAGTGAKCLRTHGSTTVGIEAFPHVQASAEGAFLGLHKYDDLKSKKSDKVEVSPILHDTEESESLWNTGKTIAEAQNFARTLAEAPANRMTPSIFVETVQQKFQPLMEQHAEKLKIIAHDKNWAEEEKMGCFLGVAAGSDEPPRFLEIHYNGAPSSEQQPIVLVGKGVTFDSGGISIKPSANMGDMRGDMGGAAAVVASVYGIASLNLPVNVIALTPLCENMPSGKATKPGDVLVAKNGKTVEVDNTDAEGRLILADALVYANKYKPHTLIDVATLTGAIVISLGSEATGVFTTSDTLWEEIKAAGDAAGERMWRLPLFPKYKKQLKSEYADLKNVGGRGAGSCTAAMFLKEFVETPRWMHLDIAGTSHSQEEGAYVPKGMTGIPTRALIKFVQTISSSVNSNTPSSS